MCLYLDQCRDNDALLRNLVQRLNVPQNVTNTITCQIIRDNELWRLPQLQLTNIGVNGPADTLFNYCTTALTEIFSNDIANFPCSSTCGFCEGKHLKKYSAII